MDKNGVVITVYRNEYKLGNKVYLDVIATGSAAAQNRHEPVQQYVSRKNSVALRGKSIELWCVFGGTPLPQIRWTKEGGSLPPGRTTYSNYGKTLIIKVRPSFIFHFFLDLIHKSIFFWDQCIKGHLSFHKQNRRKKNKIEKRKVKKRKEKKIS